MADEIHTNVIASITDLKKNPMGTVQAGGGEAVLILNHNEPAFYCVPVEKFSEMVKRAKRGTK